MNPYSIRDNVAGRNAPPFAAPNDAVAMRTFGALKFPAESPITDFSLIRMGEYDENAEYEVVASGVSMNGDVKLLGENNG